MEANVNAIAIQSKDFTWEVGYNITWNDSKITKLTTTFNPDYQGIDAGTNQKHQVGEMPGTFYLYQQVYDENGKPIQNAFVDRNNDGQITEADRYLTHKSPMAKVYMGFSSQFSYKNGIWALISVLTLAIMYTMAWHQAIALPTTMVERDLLQTFITVFKTLALPC